jgi:predicted secreted acid phosphatase
MFPRLPALLILLAVLALPLACHSAEPRNLDSAKQEITRYIDSGDYFRNLAQVAEQAERYLTQRLGEPAKPGQKLAIVFDIDETLLSNLPHMRPLGFGYVPPLWNEWVVAGTAPVIEPFAKIYHIAQAHGVTAFLISDRREKDRSGTAKNLHLHSLANYAALYLKPDASHDTAAAFKTAMRKKITEQGYTIIANLGDQESDLTGGYAEKTFKLPNPFYITE